MSEMSRLASREFRQLRPKIAHEAVLDRESLYVEIDPETSRQILLESCAIAAGDNHVLALVENGTVRAWGKSADGQTSVPSDLRTVIAIAAGAHSSMALLGDGTVRVWGGTNGEQDVPGGLVNVMAIAAGSYHRLALLADGTVRAWGGNFAGQTDVPTTLQGAGVQESGI